MTSLWLLVPLCLASLSGGYLGYSLGTVWKAVVGGMIGAGLVAWGAVWLTTL